MYIRLHTCNLRSLNIRVIDSISKRISRAHLDLEGTVQVRWGQEWHWTSRQLCIFIVLSRKWKRQSSLGQRIFNARTHTHKKWGSTDCYRWYHTGHWFCMVVPNMHASNLRDKHTVLLYRGCKNSDSVTRVPPVKCSKTRDLKLWAGLYFKMWCVQFSKENTKILKIKNIFVKPVYSITVHHPNRSFWSRQQEHPPKERMHVNNKG
jgi:hypothetical protein